MSTAITNQDDGPKTLKGILSSENMKAQFAAALPKHLAPDRFVRISITALSRTPKLKDCTPESFFKCLLDLSAAGLEPDGRRAHLIPYGKECTLIIDYKGLVELAMRAGNVASIHADKVCENDAFDYDRGKIIKHKIDFKGGRGNPYAYYVLVTFKDGSEKSDVMTKEEVELIRRRSRSGNNGPWQTDFDEMAKKTVFRRCSKWLNLSPEIREHFERDDDQFEMKREMRNAGASVSERNPFDDAPAVEVETVTEGGEA